MKSPCLHKYGPFFPCEFIDEDKNCDRCVNCPDRIKYFNSTAFPPGGFKTMTKEIKGKICASPACRFEGKPQPLMHFDVNATSKQPFRLCRECRAKDSRPDTINHENKIASMCEKAGITVEQLRGKTTHHVSAVRKTIAIELSALGVSIKKIAEMTGAPLSTAKRYLKPEEKPQDPQDKIKVAMASLAHKEIIGHISDPDDESDLPPEMKADTLRKMFEKPNEPPLSKEEIRGAQDYFREGMAKYRLDDEINIISKVTGADIDIVKKGHEAAEAYAASAMAAISASSLIDNPYQYRLTIDFSNHQDVFNDLVDVAERQLRDPAMQALFVLRYVYEKGLKISEAISTD